MSRYDYYGLDESVDHPAELLRYFTRLNYECICWILDEFERIGVGKEYLWKICRGGLLFYATATETTPSWYVVDDFIIDLDVDIQNREIRSILVKKKSDNTKIKKWESNGYNSNNIQESNS